MMLSGWGRFPRLDCKVSRPRNPGELRSALASGGTAIARGNGRAYGDSALNRQATIDMRGFNRLLEYDPETGTVVAEAGVLLAELIDVFLPRGWFPAVTPGTKFVTVGGAIAADVHGKNHHGEGSFAQCVEWIELLCPDGQTRRASRSENAELFEWTTGGMGLTGVILRAAIRLRRVSSGWISQRLLPAENLAEALHMLQAEEGSTYSVAWIDPLARGDAMGRSLVMLGEHAKPAQLGEAQLANLWAARPRKAKKVPVDFPSFALNRLSVGAFNALYYWNGRRNSDEHLIDYDSYFYPLDAILEWNRIYGRKGFAQFQCVIPPEASGDGLKALFAAIRRSGQAPFLAVLKRMGAQASRFSFPMEGYTLALDFAIRRNTQAIFAEMERIAIDHGGRFYLAKDSQLTAGLLRESDARVLEFTAMRVATGAAGAFASAQSERLEL